MDELLPPNAYSLTPEQVSDAMDEMKDMGMSPDFIKLVERGLVGHKLPKALRSAKASQAMQSAFEMIGGVPRLMLWADKNPDKFYQLYARMIPQTIAPVVAELPDSSKRESIDNMPWVAAQRLTYRLAPIGGDKIEDATEKLK